VNTGKRISVAGLILLCAAAATYAGVGSLGGILLFVGLGTLITKQ
jgi:hypothetical protein